MKITAITATPVNIPFRAPYRFALGSTASVTKTLVQVDTDEGISGVGEYAAGNGSAAIERIAPRLIGLDPLDLNACERRVIPDFSFNLWEHLTQLRRAFGAVEMALWDLRGRLEGRSVAQLLGGAVRTQIPFTEYFAFRLPGAVDAGESTPTDIARYCARMVEEYDAPTFEGKMATIDLRSELRMVREVRAAIGPDRMLRLDANGGWTLATAMEAIRKLADCDIRNFEDPVDTYDEMARLRPHAPMTFSTHNPDLPRAVRMGVPDFFVPNIVELGGIRRTVEFARAAAMLGFGFWFHSGETAVASAAYMHITAAVSTITEPHQALFHWYTDDVVAEGPFCPRGGVVALPDGPGLGVTLDPAAVARCHRRFLDEGEFPSGAAGAPERSVGSFGGIDRA